KLYQIRILKSEFRRFDIPCSLTICGYEKAYTTIDTGEKHIQAKSSSDKICRKGRPLVTVVEGGYGFESPTCHCGIQIEWVSVKLRKLWILPPTFLAKMNQYNC